MANEALVRRLGYSFRDPHLLELALSHRSVSRHRNNERLEFLGDAQLSQVISRWLFEHFPDAEEGQLTRMRAQLVRGQTLAELAREMSLGDFLNLGEGELKSGGFRRESILADALEAIIGAMLLDGGETACAERVLAWFAPRLGAISPQVVTKDPKTRLQEWLQAHQYPLPQYELVAVDGQPPRQRFQVRCRTEAHAEAFAAEGSSRRRAEQEAALLALSLLESKA